MPVLNLSQILANRILINFGEKMIKKIYQCPCCGFLTLERKPPGTFDLCPVCFWEDDSVQFFAPDYEGGANEPSLNKARNNFLKYGACEESAVKYVRNAYLEEFPENKKQ